MTWGGWAGLCWAAFHLARGALLWRDTRRKVREGRKRMANRFPEPWER